MLSKETRPPALPECTLTVMVVVKRAMMMGQCKAGSDVVVRLVVMGGEAGGDVMGRQAVMS